MTNTEKILAHIKAHPKSSAVEIYNAIDDIGSHADISSQLSRLYRQGQVDREAVTEKGRSLYRYTCRSDEPAAAATAKTTAHKAKAVLDTGEKVRNLMQASPPADPAPKESPCDAEIISWRGLGALYNCETADQLFRHITGLRQQIDDLEAEARQTDDARYFVGVGYVYLTQAAARQAASDLAMTVAEKVRVGQVVASCKVQVTWEG